MTLSNIAPFNEDVLVQVEIKLSGANIISTLGITSRDPGITFISYIKGLVEKSKFLERIDDRHGDTTTFKGKCPPPIATFLMAIAQGHLTQELCVQLSEQMDEWAIQSILDRIQQGDSNGY